MTENSTEFGKISLFHTFCPISPHHSYPAAEQPNEKIIGGLPINIAQAPWHVGLLFFGHEHRCGGSIISNRWILTAAHCLHQVTPPMYNILAGTSDKLYGGKVYAVEAHWVHEKYAVYSADYDFGVIKLQEEIIFNERIQPVQLPKIHDVDPEVDTKVLVSGWDSNRLLHAVSLSTVDRKVCNKAYKNQVTERMFCAGEKDGGKGGKCFDTTDFFSGL